MLLWLDLETTGLDPASDKILEVGVVLTRDNLEVVQTHSWVLHQDEDTLRVKMNDYVRDMHTKSGLLKEVEASTLNVGSVELELLTIIQTYWPHWPNDTDKPLICGNSVHFDKAFLKQHMPTFESKLHYRIGDASSAKELLQRLTDKLIPKTGVTAHRALTDCFESIELARKVFKPEGRNYLTIQEIQETAHQTARDKGFWSIPDPNNKKHWLAVVSQKLALIHSEVSEALEALRQVNSDENNFGEELADVIIRTADLATFCNVGLGAVIGLKLEKNKQRPNKHGKLF